MTDLLFAIYEVGATCVFLGVLLRLGYIAFEMWGGEE